MDDLIIVKSEKTPLIEFSDKGELRIEGRSYPENPLEFYQKPIKWIKEFLNKSPEKINLHVSLEYFNTGSSKLLLDIFKYLEQIKMSGSKVDLYWYYDNENENMLESGNDYASILKVPFHMVKLS